jgi:hypothetical protein
MRFDLRPGVRRLFRLPLRTTRSVHADVDDELDALIESLREFLLATLHQLLDDAPPALGQGQRHVTPVGGPLTAVDEARRHQPID